MKLFGKAKKDQNAKDKTDVKIEKVEETKDKEDAPKVLSESQIKRIEKQKLKMEKKAKTREAARAKAGLTKIDEKTEDSNNVKAKRRGSKYSKVADMEVDTRTSLEKVKARMEKALDPKVLACAFNAKELKKIKSRFDTSGKSNVVPMDTILHMPEVMMSPFFERYLRMNVKDDAVPFETFLAALGLFSPKMKMDVKKYALFQLYDVDQDGYITSIDLATILYYRFSSRISGIQLHSICGNAIDAQRNALTKNNDADGWTYEQFNELISEQEILSYMTLVL